MLQGIYAFVVFLTSACALVLEIVAGRLIAPYVGMSLYTWTAIIAVVLAGLSVGHWIGGRLASNEMDHQSGGRRIAWALALAGISSLASLVLLRVVSEGLLTAGLHPISAIVVLTGALFFLPSLFVGVVSPVLTKLAIDDQRGQTGRILGRMFAMGALGSIVGTLAAGYVFISWIGSVGTVVTVAVIYGVLAAAFAAWTRFAWVIIGAFFIPVGGLFFWGSAVSAYQSPCQTESDYFCIRTDDFSGDSGRESRVMVLDHLVHSINDKEDPTLIYSPYIHFVDELTTRRFNVLSPLQAFFIGGGGFTLPRAWRVTHPGSGLVVAEIDPAVTAVARSHMWLKDPTRALEVLHQDARAALQALPRKARFDVVFGDAFHDITVPAHLVTREFHGEIAARLKPGGFYAVNVVDLGSDPRFLFSLIKTLQSDFPAVEVWKVVDEIDEAGRVTFIVVGSDLPSAASKLDSVGGLVRAWVRWPEDDLRARVESARVPMLTDDFAPVDRLMSGLLLAPSK